MILFTLDEAEAMLGQVREQLLAMQHGKRELDRLRAELVIVNEKTGGNGHVKDENNLAQKRRRAERLVDEINERLAGINGWGIECEGHR